MGKNLLNVQVSRSALDQAIKQEQMKQQVLCQTAITQLEVRDALIQKNLADARLHNIIDRNRY